MRIAKAGWGFIARSLIGAFVGFMLTWWPEFRTGGLVVGAVCVVYGLFIAYFFRDPERPLPQDASRLYAPADGRVLSVLHESEGNDVTVRIFLSIFDVHIQRAPCAGVVGSVERVTGGFRAAMVEEAKHNNRCILRLLPEGSRPALVLEQIAGFLARRIECWTATGGHLDAGERYGMIHFGSQVAVTLPSQAQVVVAPGEKVRAGLTPIAQWTA